MPLGCLWRPWWVSAEWCLAYGAVAVLVVVGPGGSLPERAGAAGHACVCLCVFVCVRVCVHMLKL